MKVTVTSARKTGRVGQTAEQVAATDPPAHPTRATEGDQSSGVQGRTQGSAQCHVGEANSGTQRKTVASSIARPHTPHTSRPEYGKSPVTQHHYSKLAAPSSASHRCQLDLHTTTAS